MVGYLVLGVPTQILTFGSAPSFEETAIPWIYLPMCIIKAVTNPNMKGREQQSAAAEAFWKFHNYHQRIPSAAAHY